MQKKDTEQILLYYGKIEKQLDSVNMELAELRDRYSPIKGVAMDGMPHGSTPGDSTASLAVKLADNEEYQNRENELTVRRVVLKSDLQEIRQKLDRLNDDYKTPIGRYKKRGKALRSQSGKRGSLRRGGKTQLWQFWAGCSMKFPWLKKSSPARMTRAIKRAGLLGMPGK